MDSFVLALNKAHVLALNTAHVLRLNKADVLALNRAHIHILVQEEKNLDQQHLWFAALGGRYVKNPKASPVGEQPSSVCWVCSPYALR